MVVDPMTTQPHLFRPSIPDPARCATCGLTRVISPPHEPQLFAPPAHARTTDPETSHEAAASVRTTETQAAVLDTLTRWGPMCDVELVDLVARYHPDVPATPQSVRSRRAELVRRGFVTHFGYTRLPSGRRARTWRALTPAVVA